MRFDVSGLNQSEVDEIMCKMQRHNISLSIERMGEKVLLVSNC